MFCRIKQIQKSVMNDVSIMAFIRMLDYSAIASNRCHWTLSTWLINRASSRASRTLYIIVFVLITVYAMGPSIKYVGYLKGASYFK